MCHDENSFKEPHVFEPQRFLDQDEMASPPTTAIGFGFGRRYPFMSWGIGPNYPEPDTCQSESVPAASLPMHRFGSLAPSHSLQ